MNWKKFGLCAVGAILFSVLASAPASAGSFGVYGAYWDAKDPDASWGVGARVGFDFVKYLELEFHGTYYGDFGQDILGTSVDIRAIPLDGGLRFNFIPEGKVNPYVGLGFTYYFLDVSEGSIDNETGWYAEAGLEIGKGNTKFMMEAAWRKLDTAISLGAIDFDGDWSGVCGQVGVNWTWGQ